MFDCHLLGKDRYLLHLLVRGPVAGIRSSGHPVLKYRQRLAGGIFLRRRYAEDRGMLEDGVNPNPERFLCCAE